MADDSLATQTDREITGAMRDQVGKLPATLARRGTGAAPTLAPSSGAGLTYKALCERNPDYLGDHWRECRALYAGGARLLRDPEVMKRLFPAHSHEALDVYKERLARAFYIAYPGEIIDHLLAGFAQDPIRLSAGVDEDDGEELEVPTWWSEFAEDVSPPGGTRQPLGSFAVDCLREMFVTQSAWVLVDLPPADPLAEPPSSRLEEEQRGMLDPYLVLMPSDNVIDWQCDEDTGELEWVLCYWISKRRDALTDSRTMVRERWVYWTREGWQRYETSWDPARRPSENETVPLVAEGKSAFGAVPFVRITVPDGMYAMGKLHSPAREHLNKRCAASWAEYKALFAVLYEFTAPEAQGAFTPKMAPVSAAQQDPNRAVNQVRGQGYTQVRGHQDNAKYIGPEVAPFTEARASCAELMREMHRVMFSMALSANMDSAALQRSGKSKQKDSDQIAAILAKVGEIIREGFDAVLDLVALVRGETDADVHTSGGEKFDAESIADAITDATNFFAGIPVKSPTFLKRYLYRLYKLALGPSTTSDDLEAIRQELDDVVSAESMLNGGDPGGPPPPPPPGDDQGDENDQDGDREPDDRDDDKPDDPPAKSQPGGTRRLYSSAG